MRDLLPPSEEPICDLLPPSEDEGTLVELPDDPPMLFGVDQTPPRFVLVPLEPSDLPGLVRGDDFDQADAPDDFGVRGENVLPVNALLVPETDPFDE